MAGSLLTLLRTTHKNNQHLSSDVLIDMAAQAPATSLTYLLTYLLVVLTLTVAILQQLQQQQQVVKEFWQKAASSFCHPLWRQMDLSNLDPV